MMVEMAQPVMGRLGGSSGDHQLDTQMNIGLASIVVDRLGRDGATTALTTDIRTYKDEFDPFDFSVISQVNLRIGRGVRVKNMLTGQEDMVDTLLSKEGEPAETWIYEGEDEGRVYKQLLDKYHTVASSDSDITAVWVSHREETEETQGKNVRIYKLEKEGDEVVLTSYTAGGSESSMWNFMDKITGKKHDRSTSLHGATAFFNSGLETSHEEIYGVLSSSLNDQERAKSRKTLEKFTYEMHIPDEVRAEFNEQKEEAIKEQMEKKIREKDDLKTAFAMVAQVVAASVEEGMNIGREEVIDNREQTSRDRDTKETFLEQRKEKDIIEPNIQALQDSTVSEGKEKEVIQEETESKKKLDNSSLNTKRVPIDDNYPQKIERNEYLAYFQKRPNGEVNVGIDSHEKDKSCQDEERFNEDTVLQTLFAMHALYIANREIEDQFDSEEETEDIAHVEKYNGFSTEEKLLRTEKHQLQQDEEIISALVVRAVILAVRGDELEEEKAEWEETNYNNEREGEIDGFDISEAVATVATVVSEIDKFIKKKESKVDQSNQVEQVKQAGDNTRKEVKKEQAEKANEIEMEVVSLGWSMAEVLILENKEREAENRELNNGSYRRLIILLVAYNDPNTSEKVRAYLTGLIYNQLQSINESEVIEEKLKARLDRLFLMDVFLEPSIQELDYRVNTVACPDIEGFEKTQYETMFIAAAEIVDKLKLVSEESQAVEVTYDQDLKQIGEEVASLARNTLNLLSSAVLMEDDTTSSKVLEDGLLKELAILLTVYDYFNISTEERFYLTVLIYHKLQHVLTAKIENLPVSFLDRFFQLEERAFYLEGLKQKFTESFYKVDLSETEDIGNDGQQQKHYKRIDTKEKVKRVAMYAPEARVGADLEEVKNQVLDIFLDDLEWFGVDAGYLLQEDDALPVSVYREILIVVFMDLFQFSPLEKKYILDVLRISREEIAEFGQYSEIVSRVNSLIDSIDEDIIFRVNTNKTAFERNRLMRMRKARKHKNKRKRDKKLSTLSSKKKSRNISNNTMPLLTNCVIYEYKPKTIEYIIYEE